MGAVVCSRANAASCSETQNKGSAPSVPWSSSCRTTLSFLGVSHVSAEGEGFDVKDPACLGLRPPKMDIEVLDVRRATEEHDGVVVATAIEPEVESFCGARDLDTPLEQRRRVALRVGRIEASRVIRASGHRSAGSPSFAIADRPTRGRGGARDRRSRGCGRAIRRRDGAGLAVGSSGRQGAGAVAQAVGPALGEGPAVDSHEPARLAARATSNMDDV